MGGFAVWAEDACEGSATPLDPATLMFRPHLLLGNGSSESGVGVWEPTFFTDHAIDRLHDLARSEEHQPFLLVVSWRPPHPPGRAPEVHQRAVKELLSSIPVPSNRSREAPTDSFWRTAIRPNVRMRNALPSNSNEALPARLHYWASVRALDAEFGRLLDALDSTWTPTGRQRIVVFTSDHGEMLGSHGLVGKQVPWEESARVPLVMRLPSDRGEPAAGSPSFAAPRIWSEAVSSIDIAPTLLGIAGFDGGAALLQCPSCARGHADGSDISLLLTACVRKSLCQPRNEAGLDATGRYVRFGHAFGGWMALASARFKVVLTDASSTTALTTSSGGYFAAIKCFDLVADPFELHPLNVTGSFGDSSNTEDDEPAAADAAVYRACARLASELVLLSLRRTDN